MTFNVISTLGFRREQIEQQAGVGGSLGNTSVPPSAPCHRRAEVQGKTQQVPGWRARPAAGGVRGGGGAGAGGGWEETRSHAPLAWLRRGGCANKLCQSLKVSELYLVAWGLKPSSVCCHLELPQLPADSEKALFSLRCQNAVENRDLWIVMNLIG